MRQSLVPDLRSPQLDHWLDEEISALLETVDAEARGDAPMPQEAAPAPVMHPASRGPLAQVLRARGTHVPRLFRTVGTRLGYGAAAVALAVFIGWLVTQLTP